MTEPVTLGALRLDLADEHAALDAVVAGIGPADWASHTASPRWTVLDQIAHLHYFDLAAVCAMAEPNEFPALVDVLFGLIDGDLGTIDERMDELTLGPFRQIEPAQMLDRWRSGRAELLAASAELADDARVAWYGPSMSHRSFLTARLMETWAHGVDIRDALDLSTEPSARLAHIVRLGAITRDWSYLNRGDDPPPGSVRVDVEGPGGARWVVGDPDADDVVTGSALDFCLVVCQRRHLDDTTLATGDLGRDWLVKAQAFAGPPTLGPQPGDRR